MNKYLESLKNLIGYGNPSKAKYFFFSREENGDLDTDNIDNLECKRREFYIKKNNNNYFTIYSEDLYNEIPDLFEKDFKGAKNSKVYKAYYLIYKGITNKEIEFNDFIKNLGYSNGIINDLFIGNLDFIPRPKTSYTYSLDIENYNNQNLEYRKNLIIKFLYEYEILNVVDKKLIFLGFPKVPLFESFGKWQKPETTLGLGEE